MLHFFNNDKKKVEKNVKNLLIKDVVLKTHSATTTPTIGAPASVLATPTKKDTKQLLLKSDTPTKKDGWFNFSFSLPFGTKIQ